MKKSDRRRTCDCGHRYHVHARGGTKCLAVMDDGRLCWCHAWSPTERPDPKDPAR